MRLDTTIDDPVPRDLAVALEEYMTTDAPGAPAVPFPTVDTPTTRTHLGSGDLRVGEGTNGRFIRSIRSYRSSEVRFERRVGDDRFEAAGGAAGAGRVVVGDLDVPELARTATRAAVEAPVEDQSQADASAHADDEPHTTDATPAATVDLVVDLFRHLRTGGCQGI